MSENTINLEPFSNESEHDTDDDEDDDNVVISFNAEDKEYGKYANMSDTDPLMAHAAGMLSFESKNKCCSESTRSYLEDVLHWSLLYARLSVMTMFIWQTFLWIIIGKPLHLISIDLWRKYSSIIQYIITPGFLCIPFSWLRCDMYMKRSDWRMLCDAKYENSVVLANHGARIDWVMGLFICGAGFPKARVAFVVEWVIKWLPVLGWYRWLMEDIFVNRSYKHDGPRIRKNLESFHKTETKRFFYMCPEGMLCDYTNEDIKYMDSCDKFCEREGIKKFEYVLTPRYKGLGAMLYHCDENYRLLSATIAYVDRNTKLMLNEKLRSPNRVVPDWYTILTGNTDVYINMRLMPEFTQIDSDCKKALLEDYIIKDNKLKYFHENGKFEDSNDKKYEKVPVNHLQMNASFILNFLIWIGYYGVMAPNNVNSKFLYGMCYTCYTLFRFFLAIAISHNAGYYLLSQDKLSRESVPFETPIKGILYRFKGLYFNKEKDE